MTNKTTPTDRHEFKDPNIIVVTFEPIFKLVVFHVINILYNLYGNLDLIKKFNPDIRKIFIYILLEQIYTRYIAEIDNNTIFYINSNFTKEDSEIWEYIDRAEMEQFIIKNCKTISRKAPIPIFVEAGYIDLQSKSGETVDVLNKLEHKLKTFKNKNISINKLKKYCKANGLIQFIDKYHKIGDIKNNVFYHKYLKGV